MKAHTKQVTKENKTTLNETIELAKECESSALNFDKKIKNTEGANVSTNHSTFVYGNTNGFLKGYPSSIHSLGCGVIAEDKGEMQRDYWWSTSRLRGGLEKSIDVVVVLKREPPLDNCGLG